MVRARAPAVLLGTHHLSAPGICCIESISDQEPPPSVVRYRCGGCVPTYTVCSSDGAATMSQTIFPSTPLKSPEAPPSVERTTPFSAPAKMLPLDALSARTSWPARPSTSDALPDASV